MEIWTRFVLEDRVLPLRREIFWSDTTAGTGSAGALKRESGGDPPVRKRPADQEGEGSMQNMQTQQAKEQPVRGNSFQAQHLLGQYVEGGLLKTAEERERLGLVVNALTRLGNGADNLAEVAHDARNMVTALALYCDLLQEPGVLSKSFRHYAGELRLVTAASRRLVDKLATLDEKMIALALRRSQQPMAEALLSAGSAVHQRSETAPAQSIDSLAAQVQSLRTLLAALAGPKVTLKIIAEGGDYPVRLAGEDLTRILVNLVRNSVEAMQADGRIWVRVGTAAQSAGIPSVVRLAVEDTGPGIPPQLLDCVFEAGFTTRLAQGQVADSGTRGLGLSITRSLVEAAGGTIHASRRTPSGTRMEIQLPVRGK